jgi:hypothetical protein
MKMYLKYVGVDWIRLAEEKVQWLAVMNTVLNSSTVVFWVVAPCSLVGYYQYSPVTLVSTCKSARRYNSEDQHRHLHRRENVRSHTVITTFGFNERRGTS